MYQLVQLDAGWKVSLILSRVPSCELDIEDVVLGVFKAMDFSPYRSSFQAVPVESCLLCPHLIFLG